MRKLLLAAVAALALLPVASNAAIIEIDQDQKDCRVEDKCAYIFLSGQILKGDAEKFASLVQKNKIERAFVLLNSPGGLIYEAMVIGLIVHENGFLTFVGDDGLCASACADIWLAGRVKYVSETARIGFHSTYTPRKKGKQVASKLGNIVTAEYYRRLGLTEKAIRYLITTTPEDVKWLSGDLAYNLGIVATVMKPMEEKATRCQDEKGHAIVCNGEGSS